MNKFTLPVAVTLATLIAGSAFAATVTHTVKAMDAAKHTLTLDDGQTYQFPAGYDLSKVKAGEKVTVTFETKNGMHEASAVVAAK